MHVKRLINIFLIKTIDIYFFSFILFLMYLQIDMQCDAIQFDDSIQFDSLIESSGVRSLSSARAFRTAQRHDHLALRTWRFN